MQFRIENLTNGEATVKDTQSGECMHSTIGPWIEANSLYIEQSKLAHRLTLRDREPLVIYDVGLGIAANALAAFETFEKGTPCRDLHLVSFENQTSGLEFALDHAESLPFLREKVPLMRSLLQKQCLSVSHPSGSQFKWELKVGDFRSQVLPCPPPELIYYDFYSPKSLPDLWGVHCFSLLYKVSAPRIDSNSETLLFTYSSSTAVRAALLLSGFYVGYGISTGKKRETTTASIRHSDLENPLGEEWLKRWLRSDRPLPPDFPLTDFASAKERIHQKILSPQSHSK